MKQICCNCGKRIFRLVTGEWYHRHNGSVSCRPGEGSDKRAEPVAVQAERRAER